MVFSVNLSHVDKTMTEHYFKFGPAPRPASCMLRSMLLSILHGTTSITKWVDTMRSQPLFAVLSGFASDNVPGVGTLYAKNFSQYICSKKSLTRPRNRSLLKSEISNSTTENGRYFS